MQRILFYTLFFVLGFVGVSFISFYIITHPQEIVFDQTPEGIGLTPQHVTLTTADNINIAGWHFPSKQNPKQALLLIHGYPAQKADLLRIASDLYPTFSLLLIDLRSFGDSEGNMTTFGIQEQHDLRTAIDFLEREEYEHIGIFGYSLGGALAIQAAAHDDRIDAVASYGSYADLRTLAYETYAHLFILKYPLAELLNIWSQIFWGQRVFAVSPTEDIASTSVPIFIGHAQNDDIVSFHHAQQLAAAAEKEQLTTFFPDIDYHAVLPLGLASELTNFFERAFGEK